MNKWHDNDNFWSDMAPKMFNKIRWDVASEEVENIISLLEIKETDKILDLGCGPGRHSLEFARRGFNITGVDRTKAYLDNLKNKAKSENLKVKLIENDMRKFKKPLSYDIVLNLFTTFGYFENENENILVLKNIHSTLKKNGKFLIDIIGKEILSRIFRERDWYEEDGILYLEERKMDDKWSRIHNRWIKIEGNNRKEYQLSHKIYSGIELSIMLKDVGFSDIKLFGNLYGDPYNHTAERLVVLAGKPG